MKYEYFTPETIALLRNAHKKAHILQFDDVGTDHILLALTEEVALFEEAGYNPWVIHREVSRLMGEGNATEAPNMYTPMAKHVIDQAYEQMKTLHDPLVTPLHLLVSLLSETNGVAIRALTNLGIDPAVFKTTLLQQTHHTSLPVSQ